MKTPFRLWLGKPYPLGATWMGNGVNFALFSENAGGVELCLFERVDSTSEAVRIPMAEQSDQVWHAFLTGIKPGQLYGYRVDGPYEPEKGARFNSSKLLIDPYARAIAGEIAWSDEAFGYKLGDPEGDLMRDCRDDGWSVPKSVVINSSFDWGDDRPPATPLHESVIYEVHVKGFSKLCPHIPENLRGTYAGLGSSFAIEYFKRLGVTALELLPVHQHVDEQHLVQRGLANYWGYNTIAFFAPECAYSSTGVPGGQVDEFKTMVRNLHAAGIEVILDVVYNHSAEGNHLGPTLSFRGIDNANYYRLLPDQPRFYMDFTGTGNTLNVMHPRVLQLIMDSLRYWVLEMHVDGFRFDLASALARELHDFGKLSGFFDIIHQDPVISQVKLIAEPWDVGAGGYQVGNFPILWAEWNGKYRDEIRRYWKGDTGQTGELANCFSGSSSLYQTTGRGPHASINFITAHDGFSLDDLVSYNDKHNEANGEDNRDGDSNNNSWNCGAEGPTDDENVLRLRRRQRRNFLATLLLSQGVPMLCGGDEFGRSQKGNNNAYCQDNAVSWFAWDHDGHGRRLLEFCARLVHLRRNHPVFRRPKFFKGRRIRGSDVKDIMWFNTGGREMTEADWNAGYVRCLAMMLSGDTIDVRNEQNEPVTDGTFLVLCNAHFEPVDFTLPGVEDVGWELIMNTGDEDGFLEAPVKLSRGAEMTLIERSLCLLQLESGSQAQARAATSIRAR